MYRGYLHRRRDSRDHTQQQHSVSPAPSTHSPSSLANSFTSPSGSSVFPGSQTLTVNPTSSDFPPFDHSVPQTPLSTPSKSRFFALPFTSTNRSAPAARMGQGQSRAGPVPQPYSPAAPPALPLPPPTGRLKRAWGRRKKSEDVTAGLSGSQHFSDKGKGRDGDAVGSAISSALTTPASSTDNLQSASSSSLSIPQHGLKAPKFSGAPPLPPPKPEQLRAGKPSPSSYSEGQDYSVDSPPLVISPGSSGAIAFSNSQSEKSPEGSSSTTALPKSDTEMKQDWRKSDATTMSYVTIRPNARSGTRSPRPVSWAESSHSGHTIVPASRRLSALITDAEYAMAEEDDSDSEQDIVQLPPSGRFSPTSAAIKKHNRRSASLNIGPAHRSRYGPLDLAGNTSPPLEGFPLSRTLTGTPSALSSTSQDRATLSTVAAKGFIAPTAPPGAAHSTSSNIRNRIAAWTATAPGERTSPPPPPSHPASSRHTRRPSPPSNPSFRQTAISITGSFAPVAFGLGKRAAEKVHRVWGGLNGSSSGHSAYSSTSSLNGSLSASGSANAQPSLPGGWKSKRRTPNAPSGAWSVSSSVTTLSDADGFPAVTGPTLGTCLRGPQLNRAGASVAGGVVFGRDLWTCVQQTAVEPMRARLDQQDALQPVSTRRLEERLLPAIVVRCAQHLHVWGVQEEGLFRVNGRPAHVARLRSEFDTGADYNLVECDPGDLDPHAVASIFKAYLRELPQSLLTPGLVPLFESALAADASAPEPSSATPTAPGASKAFPMLRKPPSLSTLAMPSFAGQRSMSKNTIETLASLVAELPQENLDLLYTVVELMKATAANSKETRMTIGNLLLVFCPSLNMSPALLRVLCEVPGIWQGRPASTSSSPAPVRALSQGSQQDGRISTYVDAPSTFDRSDTVSSNSGASDLSDTRLSSSVGASPYISQLRVSGGSPYRSSNNSSSGQDDAASYVSARDHPPSPSDDSSSNLPALTTSTDSLATPSTMSESSSLQPAIIMTPDEMPSEKSTFPSSPMPVIANPVDLSLPLSARRPFISSPVPASSNSDPSPRSPVSPRKSLSLLTFPALNKSEQDSSNESPTWSGRQRPKRPSLHLLFSKKSSASLASPAISAPEPIEAPAGMLCVPISARKDGPPVINMPITPPSIGLLRETSNGKDHSSSADISRSSSSLPLPDSARSRSDSSGSSSLFATPQQTPIADYYRGQSPSLLSVYINDETTSRSRSASPVVQPSPLRRSETPLIDMGIEPTAEDDWAESVLKEAASSTQESVWSVKDAVKLFNSH